MVIVILLQCVAASALCDKKQDCRDGSDEELCWNYGEWMYKEKLDTIFPPAAVHMDGHGQFKIQSLASFSLCPQTHFLCQGTFFVVVVVVVFFFWSWLSVGCQ